MCIIVYDVYLLCFIYGPTIQMVTLYICTYYTNDYYTFYTKLLIIWLLLSIWQIPIPHWHIVCKVFRGVSHLLIMQSLKARPSADPGT